MDENKLTAIVLMKKRKWNLVWMATTFPFFFPGLLSLLLTRYFKMQSVCASVCAYTNDDLKKEKQLPLETSLFFYFSTFLLFRLIELIDCLSIQYGPNSDPSKAVGPTSQFTFNWLFVEQYSRSRTNHDKLNSIEFSLMTCFSSHLENSKILFLSKKKRLFIKLGDAENFSFVLSVRCCLIFSFNWKKI